MGCEQRLILLANAQNAIKIGASELRLSEMHAHSSRLTALKMNSPAVSTFARTLVAYVKSEPELERFHPGYQTLRGSSLVR